MLIKFKTHEGFCDLYKGGRFLGEGTTANVYLKDGKVFKIYDFSKKKNCMLFAMYNMEQNLSNLSKLNIKNVHVPKDIYKVENEVSGISLDYVKGCNLHNLLNGIDIDENTPNINLSLFLEYLEELDEIIQKFNELKITCYDFHCGNVIINENGINIIDTDQYAFEEERPAINNFRFFFSHIFNEIFDIGYYFMPDENFRFYSKHINSLYEKYLNGRATKEDYFKLYRAISKELGYDTEIKDAKRLTKELGKFKI